MYDYYATRIKKIFVNNKLTEKQKELFLQTYQTALSSLLPNLFDFDSLSESGAISEAIKVALHTVYFLTDDFGELRTVDDMLHTQNDRYDLDLYNIGTIKNDVNG